MLSYERHVSILRYTPRWVHLACCLAGITSCQMPTVQDPDPTPPATEQDPAYEGPGQIFARHVMLSTTLQRGNATRFARLMPRQQQLLRSLTSRPDWQLTIIEAAGRMLITFPQSHPYAGLELLLAQDQDQLVLFAPARKLRHVMPLSRLPDLLDGVSPSHRGDFELNQKSVPISPQDRLRLGATKHAALEAQLSLRYFPSVDKPTNWPIRMALRVESPERIAPPALIHPLLPLALPLLQSWRGQGVLETITLACGAPSGWSLSVTNENKSSRIPLTFVTKVMELGYIRIPLARLSMLRPRFQTAPQTTILSAEPGHQNDYAQNLPALRDSKKRGSLTVHNPTKTLVYIYADGVLLGWVRPGGKMSFENIPEGFFRIFAISPTGLRSWGPLDSYIPGPVTLR